MVSPRRAETPSHFGQIRKQDRSRPRCLRVSQSVILAGVRAPFPLLLLSRDLGGGGSQRQLVEVARRIDRSQFSPHVGCFYTSGLRLQELENARVPVTEFPVRSFRSPSVFRVAASFGRYLRENRIQIVHSFDVPMNLFAASAARWFRAPIIISSQRASRALTPGFYRRWLQLTDRIVDAIVVNSAAVQRELEQEDGVPSERLRLCYNCLDTEHFHARRPARIEALRGATLVIGSTAMFRPEKGLSTLIEAFAKVRQDGMKLVLVGDGPLLEDLESMAKRLGVHADCLFPGPQSDVADWLRQMDIFVLPSLSEALSNSLLEAMACGCTVVASRVGGNPELVCSTANGETGLLFEAGQAASLAQQLLILAKDASLRERISASAQAFVNAHFTPQQTIRCFHDIYTELLAKKGLACAA